MRPNDGRVSDIDDGRVSDTTPAGRATLVTPGAGSQHQAASEAAAGHIDPQPPRAPASTLRLQLCPCRDLIF